MPPEVMVVLIVAIVMVASIFKARYRHHARLANPKADTGETKQLREEVKVLKDRIAVLERIATDKHTLLEQEFDRLKDDR